MHALSRILVIVTDNAPVHNGVEVLARETLARHGVLSVDPIDGCWSTLTAQMKGNMAKKNKEFLIRGEYDTYVAQQFTIMK
ncbi:hypothetical protein GN244_ATG18894 [Phytophthora infestans]|uniref:Tc1-like transposase DDE domain-containing protein n=1 Tax=Phytophthora infestans TaxID=4787 RepID=A0A833WDC1_PHYIN|nr:hypothetical protein GN244_ATG18894 [Phytophthora infestans]